MPKSETSNSKNAPPFDGPRYRPKWLAASVCFLLGAWLFVTLLDYAPRQSHEFQIGGQSAWNGKEWVIQNRPAPSPNLGRALRRGDRLVVPVSFWDQHVGDPDFPGVVSWVAVRNARRFVFTRALAMMMCLMTAAGLAAMVESFKPATTSPWGSAVVLGSCSTLTS